MALFLATAMAARADASFRAWASGTAAQHQQAIASWGPAHLDEVKGTQRVAVLIGVAEGGRSAPFAVLVEDGSRRWVHEFEPDPDGVETRAPPYCEGAAKTIQVNPLWVVWPCGALSFSSGALMSHAWSSRVVALRKGRWVVLLAKEGYQDQATIEDYSALKSSQMTEEDAETQAPATMADMLLVLRPSDAPARPRMGGAPIAGASRWKGLQDASLGVGVIEEERSARLQIETRDDVRIPVGSNATNREFLAADHLELWFCERCSAKENAGAGGDAFQLGIAARADGSLEARWLWPEAADRALPKLRGSLARLEVELPEWALPKNHRDGERERWHMAFAYSDSDTKGGRQEKLIALEPYAWGKPETFAGALQLPGVTRYPEAAGFKLVK